VTSDRPPVRATALTVVVGLLAVVLATVPPPGSTAATWAYLVPVATCVATTHLAVRRVPADARRPWRWLAGALDLYLTGEVLFALQDVRGDGSWSALAEACYLLAYVPTTVGLLALDRRRSRTRYRGNLLDAGILSLSATTLFGVFVILPVAADSTQPLPARVVSSAYPVCDLVLVLLVTRLVTGSGDRPPGFWLLVAGTTSTVAADVWWDLQQLTTGGGSGRVLNVLWLLYYVGFAAAAVDARTPWRAAAAEPDGLTARRLSVLAVAAVLPSGVLVVLSALGRPAPVTWLAAGSVALVVLVVARVWDLLQQLRRQSLRLEAMARTDPLTGLANRRTLDHHLARLCRPGAGGEVVLALLDLDHFKAYNDSRGHQAGDDLLRAAGAAWAGHLAHLGPRGLLARWGGEEFVAVVAGESPERAVELLDELRALVPEGQTCSVGVGRWDGTEPPAETLRRADALLYEAKAAGRDRLVGPRPPRAAERATPAGR
jgi:diguanylate cyclase (GGDEF)-like protein